MVGKSYAVETKQIIAKAKTKQYRTAHKYDMQLPNDVIEALELDKLNGNNYWERAIKKEMTKVHVAFKPQNKNTSEKVRTEEADNLIKCQEIIYLIFFFDAEMNLTWKASLVTTCATTETLTSLTFLSIVAKLSFLIKALNDLDVISCDKGTKREYSFKQDLNAECISLRVKHLFCCVNCNLHADRIGNNTEQNHYCCHVS